MLKRFNSFVDGEKHVGHDKKNWLVVDGFHGIILPSSVGDLNLPLKGSLLSNQYNGK